MTVDVTRNDAVARSRRHPAEGRDTGPARLVDSVGLAAQELSSKEGQQGRDDVTPSLDRPFICAALNEIDVRTLTFLAELLSLLGARIAEQLAPSGTNSATPRRRRRR